MFAAYAANPYVKGLFWLMATVFSAFVGIVAKAYWDAPRPVTELVSVELASPKFDGKINISTALAARTKAHLYFSDISNSAATKEILDAISDAQIGDSRFQGVSQKIDALIDLLKTRAGAADVRRLEFLLKWSEDGTGETLSRVVKSMVARKEATLPGHYSKHPKGQEGLTISLSPSTAMALSEIDEEQIARGQAQVKGPVNVYEDVKRDARRTNLLRRLWVYLEPEVLVPILLESKEYMRSVVKDSEDIVVALRKEMSKQNPEHLIARVLVTNRGAEPIAIRNVAAVALRIPVRESGAASSSEIEAIRMTGESEREFAYIVEGGKALSLTFRSVEPLTALVKSRVNFQAVNGQQDSLQSSRLMQLFEAGGVAAAIRLARAGSNEADAPLTSSDFRPVGPQSSDGLYKILLGS